MFVFLAGPFHEGVCLRFVVTIYVHIVRKPLSEARQAGRPEGMGRERDAGKGI